MTCASLESAMLRWVHAPNKGMRRIAILMFNDCSLQGAGVVAEVFQAANELASSGPSGCSYDVCFLSADGGMVTSSAALRVWTDGLDARHYSGFDALYVAGGKGAIAAARDERLIAWLRRVRHNTGMIRPIAEGRARHLCIARRIGENAASERAGRRRRRSSRVDAQRARHDQARPGRGGCAHRC